MFYKKKKGVQIKKVQYQGITFDSKLELFFYKELKKAKIPFEFQRKYVLLDKFRYDGKAVRQMTLTVDFYIPKYNSIVDTKGFQRNDNKIKWKLLRRHLLDNGKEYHIFLPNTQKKCLELIKYLLNL
jgi:hypothetical protein|tara:strand:+ start:379 stop:759 length:381 start_codon:yes stop_codon:yes gene_type:complete